MATTIDLGTFHKASVDRLRFTITKDGVAWTGIDSIALVFEKPDRSTSFTRAMSLETTNVWYYDTDVGDLDEAGRWTLSAVVTDGAIVKTYPHEMSLLVLEQPWTTSE